MVSCPASIRPRSALLWLLVSFIGGSWSGAVGEGLCSLEDATCRAGISATGVRRHPWPSARGPLGAYGVTPHKAPRNLTTALAWTWAGQNGRFSTVLNGGIVIDDQLNLYTAAVNGIHKLSPDGRLLWTKDGQFSGAPVLVGDALYSDSKDGRMFALDLDTGASKWETRVADTIGPDCHSVGVSEGVMVTGADGGPMGGNKKVVAVNASNGQVLWTFQPDNQLWNIMPMFTGNGSLLFQDQVGGAYHLDLFTGKPIWRAGIKAGWDEFWTDGMSWLGPNGLFYAAHVHAKQSDLKKTSPSELRAFRVSDGEQVWRREFPYPINSQPVVALLKDGGGHSLVMNSGLQAGLPPNFVAGLCAILGFVGGLVLALCLGACRCLCGRPKRFRLCFALGLPFGAACVLAALGGSLYIKQFPGGFPSEVQVLNASTGELQWRYEFPVWETLNVRADDEGILKRIGSGVQPFCIPNGWGSPSVDASGTIWLGHQSGLVYGFRDANKDGALTQAEVVQFDMTSSSTHFGGAYAPGMMVWTSCDTVFVFKE